MEVRVPVTKVTSAAFGGADLADLYITTASIRFPGETSEPEAHAGSLFVCRPGQTGKLSNKFRWV
jgi:sugar lactone lactonase YvrE